MSESDDAEDIKMDVVPRLRQEMVEGTPKGVIRAVDEAMTLLTDTEYGHSRVSETWFSYLVQEVIERWVGVRWGVGWDIYGAPLYNTPLMGLGGQRGRGR
ncbi:hypothetical protein KIPB_010367 [Kipferlia bialata]|uniref:Uncharacterized protein n=1 Tax=Kipferlia bialata TaxID=797122 RepID=A0A391NPH2_9EUKA|nr:hypothetical protein KIPB_010367 [Kipferlia bialata]|eukprot:g10367.t1